MKKIFIHTLRCLTCLQTSDAPYSVATCCLLQICFIGRHGQRSNFHSAPCLMAYNVANFTNDVDTHYSVVSSQLLFLFVHADIRFQCSKKFSGLWSSIHSVLLFLTHSYSSITEQLRQEGQ